MLPDDDGRLRLRLPARGLVVLVGVSGSGKSTFAREHFKATEVISSDFCRALVADDENDQSATPDAFDVLHYLAGTRLRRGLLTVVDATNVQAKARAELVALARSHDALVDAVVLDVPESGGGGGHPAPPPPARRRPPRGGPPPPPTRGRGGGPTRPAPTATSAATLCGASTVT